MKKGGQMTALFVTELSELEMEIDHHRSWRHSKCSVISINGKR